MAEKKGGLNIELVMGGVGKFLQDAAKADDSLKRILDTLDKISRGNNLQKYWNDQYKSIEGLSDAFEKASKHLTEDGNVRFMPTVDAEELIRSMNAVAAHTKQTFDEVATQMADRFGIGAQAVISKASELSQRLDSAFSIKSMRDAFAALDDMRAASEESIEMLNRLDSSSTKRLKEELSGAKAEIFGLQQQLMEFQEIWDRLGSGGDVSGVLEQIEGLEKRIRDIRNTAIEEFETFLSGNDISSNFSGAQKYFENIADGTMTARQAIAEFKAEYESMFAGGVGGDMSAIYALFSQIRDAISGIPEMLESVITRMHEIGAFNGELSQSADHMQRIGDQAHEIASSGADLQPMADAITNIAAGIKETGDGSSTTLASLQGIVEALGRLGGIDSGNLTNISVMLRSIASMNGFTASSKGLDTLVTTLDRLSQFRDTSALVGLSSVDLSKLKVSKAALENLATYLPQIQGIDVSPLERLANINWTNLEGLKLTKTNLQNVTSLVKDAGLQAAQGAFKLDETSLSSLSQMIQDAVQKATANVKITIDNVDLSAAAKKAVADSVEKAATGAKKETGKTSGGTQDAINAETEAIKKQTEEAWKNHDAWDARQRAMLGSRDAGWKQADALAKEEESIKKEADAMMRAADQIEEAGTKIVDAKQKISTAQDSPAEDRSIEQIKEEFDGLEELIRLYEQYYSLRSQEATAINKNVDYNADLLNSRAQAIWEEIAAIEEANPALAELAGSHERVTAAVRASQVAINNADATETVRQAKTEAQALDELAKKYEQYYAFKSKQITSTNKADLENADIYRSRAEAIWEEIKAIEAEKPKLAELVGEHERVIAAVQKWQETANRGQAKSDSVIAKRIVNEAKELDALQAKLDKLGVGKSGIKFGGDIDAVERYKAVLADAKNALDLIGTKTGEERVEAVNNFNQIITSVEHLKEELNNAFSSSSADAALTKRIETMKTQLVSFMNSNSKWYEQNKGAYDAIFAELSQGASIGKERVLELQTELVSLNGQMKASGATGKSFFQQMSDGWRKFGGWSVVTRSFTAAIRIMKQAVTAVKEVDAAMTELRKVTDLTSQGYEDFYKSAVQMATQVGSKLSDAISATADFSRLGYNIKDASALAQAALIYTNVGDSIESISDATTSIISTMKAFNIEAQNSMDIVDMFNEVGRWLPIPVVTRCLEECYIGQSSVGKCA